MHAVIIFKSSFFFFFLGLTIKDSVVGRSPRQGPGPCSTCRCTDTEENLMSPCPRETTTSRVARTPPKAHRAHPGTEKQVIRIVADFSQGRLSHSRFYFTRIGLRADSSEDGCVLLQEHPHRAFACSFLGCKASRRLRVLGEGNPAQAARSSLLPRFHF